MKRSAALAALALLIPLATCRDAVAPDTKPAVGIAAVGGRAASVVGTWGPIASTSIARFEGMAATGLDGRIYLFGGLTFSTDRKSVV